MQPAPSGGIWTAFVPGVGSGAYYQYLVHGADDVWRQKADPLAFAAEAPPATGSRVFESTHVWKDDAWLAERSQKAAVKEPMSVYEMHLGSWKRHPDGSFWTYDELADPVDGLPAYLADLGFTHVELMPVMQHPFGGSWGYHVTSYFAPDARFGDPDGFRRLVDALHQAGVGVILDWVPGHFATDEWALVRFDGTPLYEHPDPRRGWHPEWGSHIFDFGRHEVRNFLFANALYWLEEFHADGLRVDGVASMLYLDYARDPGEWVPNKYGGHENLEAVQFLQELNATVYKRVPGIVTVAEESTSWPGVTGATSGGGLGFGFKWNMGWMHDSLGYLQRDPVHRAYHHGELTFALVYAYSENYVLPLSHDEVVHGKGSLPRKMPGDAWQQLANLRAYLAYMWAHPGKPLVFMGTEFAQVSEWAESRELDWCLLSEARHRRHAEHGPRPQPALRRDCPRCGARTTSPTASPGSTPTTPATTSSPSSAGPRASPTWPASPTSPTACTPTTGSGFPWPARGPRCSTPTPSSTAARGWATSAWSPPRWRPTSRRGPRAAARRTPSSRCRRWRRSGCARPPPLVEVRAQRASKPSPG